MQHLDEGTVHAWLDGALSGEEHARVEAHVASCASCAAAVADARGLAAGASRIVASLDSVPGGVVPVASANIAKAQDRSLWRSLRLTPARAALAASIMIAVAAVLAGKAGDSATRRLGGSATRRELPATRRLGDSATRREMEATTRVETTERRTAASLPGAAAAPSTQPASAVTSAERVESLAVPAESPSRRVAGSSRRVAESPAVAGPGGMAPRGRRLQVSADVQGLSTVVTTAAGAPSRAPQCFQLGPDSIAVRASVPLRFALERGEAAGTVAVRSASGSQEGPLNGATWEALASGTIKVTFPRATLVIDGDKGRVSWDGEEAQVVVTRLACN